MQQDNHQPEHRHSDCAVSTMEGVEMAGAAGAAVAPDATRAAEELSSIMYNSLHPLSSAGLAEDADIDADIDPDIGLVHAASTTDTAGAAATTPNMTTPAAAPMTTMAAHPPHDRRRKTNHIIPPARPSSTPFPHPDRRNSVCCQESDRDDLDGLFGQDTAGGDDNNRDDNRDGNCDGNRDDNRDGNRDDNHDDGNNGSGENHDNDDESDHDMTDQSVIIGSSPSTSVVEFCSSTSEHGPSVDPVAGAINYLHHSLSPDNSNSHGHNGPVIVLTINDLPADIHEVILDHLFGYRISASSKSSVGMHCVTRSWATVLRHSRRRELAQLALVSPMWRCLIQERLYRHIKLEATVQSVDQAAAFFARHTHLKSHVRHIEMWFPVFQRPAGALSNGYAAAAGRIRDATASGRPTPAYTLHMGKCTIQEAFNFISVALPHVRILTLEGGERRKAPKILHFIGAGPRRLPVLPSVQTLVTKGQWNLARDKKDFDTILAALPNLREWHGSYSRPKSKTYLSMAMLLPYLPKNITELDICLEGEYRSERTCPAFFLKVSRQLHFCLALAAAAPNLERLSYTGRLCRAFFDALSGTRPDSTPSKLKYVNVTARNICRHGGPSTDTGCGVQNASFIQAFELLVVSAIRSLARVRSLEFLRIRYIDLDFAVPQLSPFFLVKDGWCAGVWSQAILRELARSRPSIQYEDVRETFGDISYNKDGRMVITPEYPRFRVLSLKLSNYAMLSKGISVAI